MRISLIRTTTELLDLDLTKLPHFHDEPKVLLEVMKMYFSDDNDWHQTDSIEFVKQVQRGFAEPDDYRDGQSCDYEIYLVIEKCYTGLELAQTLLNYGLDVSWFIESAENNGFHTVSATEFYDRLSEFVYLNYKDKLDSVPWVSAKDTAVDVSLPNSDSFDTWDL